MLTKEEIENLLVINDEKLDEEVSEQTRELINKVEKELEERGCDDIYHDLVTELLIRTQDEAYKIGLKDGSHFEEIQKNYKGEDKMREININYWSTGDDRKQLEEMMETFKENWEKIQEKAAKKNGEFNANYSWEYWFEIDNVGSFTYYTDSELAITLYEFTRGNLNENLKEAVKFVLNYKGGNK